MSDYVSVRQDFQFVSNPMYIGRPKSLIVSSSQSQVGYVTHHFVYRLDRFGYANMRDPLPTYSLMHYTHAILDALYFLRFVN